jgi:hypothetical protein
MNVSLRSVIGELVNDGADFNFAVNFLVEYHRASIREVTEVVNSYIDTIQLENESAHVDIKECLIEARAPFLNRLKEFAQYLENI